MKSLATSMHYTDTYPRRAPLKWIGAKSIQLDRGSATNLPVLAKCYVIWAVRGQFWPLAQLVSSSKFKLVCQLVNAKKPKKSRVTHLQLKGVMKFYY